MRRANRRTDPLTCCTGTAAFRPFRPFRLSVLQGFDRLSLNGWRVVLHRPRRTQSEQHRVVHEQRHASDISPYPFGLSVSKPAHCIGSALRKVQPTLMAGLDRMPSLGVRQSPTRRAAGGATHNRPLTSHRAPAPEPNPAAPLPHCNHAPTFAPPPCSYSAFDSCQRFMDKR